MKYIHYNGRSYVRYYHYLIRPISDWDNSRAREYISTSKHYKVPDGWEIVSMIGYHDKEVNNHE